MKKEEEERLKDIRARARRYRGGLSKWAGEWDAPDGDTIADVRILLKRIQELESRGGER